MSARGTGEGGGDAPFKAAVTRRIAEAWSAMDGIRVDYGPQDDAVEGLMQALHGALARPPGAACGVVTLIAPRGVGKSATLDLVVERARTELPDEPSPVLRVPMDTAGSVESVPSAILRALKDPRPDLGKPQLRWLKADDRLRAAGVRLLAFDEFNRAARRPTMSGPIGHAICERIVDAGVASVAIVGEEDSSVVLERAPLLFERVDEELDLSPLDWHRPGDDAIWSAFVDEFDAEMARLDLVAAPTGFAVPATAERLCAASGGIVRRFVKIVRLALAEAMRRGDRVISPADLREAAERFAVGRGFLASNPFDGVAP